MGELLSGAQRDAGRCAVQGARGARTLHLLLSPTVSTPITPLPAGNVVYGNAANVVPLATAVPSWKSLTRPVV